MSEISGVQIVMLLIGLGGLITPVAIALNNASRHRSERTNARIDALERSVIELGVEERYRKELREVLKELAHR